MSLINSKRMLTILKDAKKRLKGEWLLLGGSLLNALDIDVRTTTDIDMIGLSGERMENDLILMDIAQEHQLPVEAINQSAMYFLTKVKNWKEHLVVFMEGEGLTIYRPDLLLYIQLKVARFTESDFTDCIEYIAYYKEQGDYDQFYTGIKEHIKSVLKEEKNQNKAQRLHDLMNSL